MFGQRIQELRRKAGVSARLLATGAALSSDALDAIERGTVTTVSTSTLLRIADALHLDHDEFIYLMKLQHNTRRFHAYNVGIAKTGTRSIGAIFRHYRSTHEFMFEQTTGHILQFQKGQIDGQQLRKYIRQRDNEGILEMDSSSFNYAYLHILIDEFPSAKFIFTIRDAYSWVDSLLNMFLSGSVINSESPQWMYDYTEHLFGLDRSMVRSKRRVVKHFDSLIDKLLVYWSSTNSEILDKLPLQRSLIVRTHEISSHIDRIADLVGVPRRSLHREQTHLHQAARKFNVLQEIDRGLLSEKVDCHCSALMKRFYPGYRLADFLETNEPEGRLSTSAEDE